MQINLDQPNAFDFFISIGDAVEEACFKNTDFDSLFDETTEKALLGESVAAQSIAH